MSKKTHENFILFSRRQERTKAGRYFISAADLAADIKSITALIMEAPCCSKMPLLIQQGMALAGKKYAWRLLLSVYGARF